MVRKAATLKSLDELSISAAVRSYLEGKFSSLNEIVFYGRSMAEDTYEQHPELTEDDLKATLELIRALDEAGFIRHDIKQSAFCVSRLYRFVFQEILNDATAPYRVAHLCEVAEKASYGELVYRTDFKIGNQRYETLQNPTEEQLSSVKAALETRLSAKEYAAIMYRFGFEDGELHTFEDTSKYLNTTKKNVIRLGVNTLRKLQVQNELPPILPASVDQVTEVKFLIAEYKKLRAEETKLRQKLREKANLPFECALEARKCLKGEGVYDITEIEDLNLSTKVYTSLKRAGINTVADIFKVADWYKFKSLGYKNLVEIETKVRARGYTDFNINVD